MTADARALFEGIAPVYGAPAEIFSFGQYGRWRRFAVKRLAARPGSPVLDVATGTGLVARDIRRRTEARVVGIDLTHAMLVRGSGTRVCGRAERLPFSDETFGGLVHTYLLRYVDDPASTLVELVRVLRPGAPMVSIEFGVPRGGITSPLWRFYARKVFPVGARIVSRGWGEVGEFLPGSIAEFGERLPPEHVADLWRAAGMQDVVVHRMSFGAGVITCGVKG